MRFWTWLWQMVLLGALQTQRWAREGHVKLTVEERRKILFKKLELYGLKSWTEENKEKALNLLAKYHDIFALEDGEMGCTKAAKHKIKVTDEKPFKERLRSIPSGLLDEVKDHLNQMLNMGAIKPSKSVWSNAMVLVQKKDGGLRFCINFQRLDAQTQKDAFLLPQIHDAIDILSQSKYYTTVDLLSGFWQTPMEEAFTVGMLGFFQCKCMPFGLCNAPATFQQLMMNQKVCGQAGIISRPSQNIQNPQCTQLLRVSSDSWGTIDASLRTLQRSPTPCMNMQEVTRPRKRKKGWS